MDALDVKIITLLQDDGSPTNSAIAREVGVSEETVRRRLAILKREGVFTILAVPYPEKVGYNCQVLLRLHATPENVEGVARAIGEFDEVLWVVVTSGVYSVMAHAMFPSNDELTEFLTKKANQIPGLEQVETFVLMDTKKREFSLTPILVG